MPGHTFMFPSAWTVVVNIYLVLPSGQNYILSSTLVYGQLPAKLFKKHSHQSHIYCKFSANKQMLAY